MYFHPEKPWQMLKMRYLQDEDLREKVRLAIRIHLDLDQ